MEYDDERDERGADVHKWLQAAILCCLCANCTKEDGKRIRLRILLCTIILSLVNFALMIYFSGSNNHADSEYATNITLINTTSTVMSDMAI